MRKEIERANKIIEKSRNKKVKTNKEYEAIIDLSYFVTIASGNKETKQANYILDRLITGYYDEVDNKEEIKKQELKLSDDNMQYCFFCNYCEINIKENMNVKYKFFKIKKRRSMLWLWKFNRGGSTSIYNSSR